MENTVGLLVNRTVRELNAVACCYGLPFNNRQPKALIYAHLSEQLHMGQHLQRAYRTLASKERDALRTLQAAGGAMSANQFARDFGMIRPYRPWDAQSPQQPWKHMASIAEKLWYLAFIELQDQHVMLCDEIMQLLPALPRVHPIPDRLAGEPPTPDALLADMAAFLGMLTRQRVRLIHGQQLPPLVFRAINARLSQPESGVDRARSERGIGRVRWLHYLAACANLLDRVNGTLKPGFAAWGWLSLTPDERWQMLINAIRADLEQPTPLWKLHHLPHISPSVWDALISGLESLTVGAVYNVRTFLRMLRIQCPGLIAEDVRALLAGPLSWLGLIMLSADGKQFACIASNCPTLTTEHFAAWTMHENGIDIYLNAMPPLRPLVEALAWIGIIDDGLHLLRIDAEAVQRALRCNLDVLQIADEILRLTGAALPQKVFDQLTMWVNHADQLRIEHADLLYAADPELLSSLYADRRLRMLLDKPISPHHAIIHVGMRERLNHRLQRRGYRAQSETPDSPVTPDVTHDIAASAWLAMRVYQSLGALVPQTLPIPGAVSDELKVLLSDQQRDQLEQAASQLVEAVRQAIRGDTTRFNPSPIAQDDPAAVRMSVERAYQERQSITIVYFSPAHGYPIQRIIEPMLPIRWEGEYGYVEAWCRLDNAPRTFRLDRILRLVT